MPTFRALTLTACSALTLAWSGCASVTVEDSTTAAAPPATRLDRPTQFVVQPFEVDRQRVKENPYRKHPGQLANESSQLVSTQLVEELKKLGYPATLGGEGQPPQGSWLVSGQITRVAEGNRLLRMGIGLGAGGTKMETQVQVTANRTSVLHFRTTGGSNAMPGAATTPIPFSGLPAALMAAKDGVTADSARTARMIAARIAEELSRKGWLEVRKPAIKMAHSQRR